MKTNIVRSLIVFILLLSSFAPAGQVYALNTDTTSPQAPSLADMLNPDGTLNLNTGFHGTLNLSDWQVSLDPQRGPILRTATNTWQQMQNGTNGNVSAMAIDGNGNIYIGGSFTAICGNAACNSGNVTLHGLAVWNGASWQGLGGYGMNGGIYAITLSGNNVYIGGIFDKICSNASCTTGTNAKNVAYWNGSTWSGFGFGLDNFVFALAANGNTVYAGGNFNNICGNSACNSGNTAANYIAKWDGVQWSSIGYGVNSAVYALLLNGSDLYTGGYFSHLCGNAACSFTGASVNYIARWSTSTSTWYSIGNGLNNDVRAIALGASNAIYVGGFFTQTCGNQTCNSSNITVNRIAKWNGTTWSALGNGVNSDVYAVTTNGSNVYVAGNLSQICGNAACNSANTTVNHVTAWNGSTWSTLANGVNYSAIALAATSTSLYTGGLFTLACGDAACSTGNTTANYVAKFSVPLTATIYSTGTQDGWILESSETSDTGSSVNTAATSFYLGDNATRKQYRGMLSFNTGTALPDTAVITRITLKLKQQASVGGGNPVSTLQGFMTDIKTGYFGTFAALQIADFEATASKTLGPSIPTAINNWYSINLTNGQAYINKLSTNAGLTQIRLRFKVDDNNDAVANYLSLFSGDATAADRPQLVIAYYVP